MDLVPSIFLAIMALLMVSLPRERAIAPLLLTSVLMTIGPEFAIGPAKFTVMRSVIVVGLIRVMAKGEGRDLIKGPIDRVVMWWAVVTVIMLLIPLPRHPNAVMPIRTLGDQTVSAGRFLVDLIGMYYLARCFVRNKEDIQYATKILIFLAVVIGGFMTVEKLTGRNLMAFLGAVPEVTVIRNGKLRCQGSFTHPIHAGTFGSTLMPLCLGMWLYGQRKLASIGAAAATLVVIASASSGPLMSWVAGCVAIFLWTMRDRMHLVRRLILLAFITAEIGMKGHAWWLIAKISDIVGGGGYWRAKLIDEYVNHFSEWWLQGTSYTAHWSPTGVGLPLYPDFMDITNQFVAEGVNGGLLKMILYIAIIVACFKKAGQVARNESIDRETQIIFWSLGSMVFAYCMSFLAVANSAQNSIIFFWMVAAIALIPEKVVEEAQAESLEGRGTEVQHGLSYGHAWKSLQ